MNNFINALLECYTHSKHDGFFVMIKRDEISVDIDTFFNIYRAYHGTNPDKIKITIYENTYTLRARIGGIPLKTVR